MLPFFTTVWSDEVAVTVRVSEPVGKASGSSTVKAIFVVAWPANVVCGLGMELIVGGLLTCVTKNWKLLVTVNARVTPFESVTLTEIVTLLPTAWRFGTSVNFTLFAGSIG